MFVGVPSSGKTILTWTGNKRDILGQLILTSLSSSVKFIHIFLLFPKNTVNIEGGSLFNFTHLWNNHPYHEAQGLVRKRGEGHWTILRAAATPASGTSAPSSARSVSKPRTGAAIENNTVTASFTCRSPVLYFIHQHFQPGFNCHPHSRRAWVDFPRI